MKTPSVTDNRGFTLVELLIALTIFAVGVLAVASMQLNAMNHNARSGKVTQATFLAERKIEELISLDYNHADLQDLDGDGAAGLGNGGELPDPVDFDNNPGTNIDSDYMEVAADPYYTIFWNVQVDFPVANSKTIRVIVRWPGGGSRSDATLTAVKPRL